MIKAASGGKLGPDKMLQVGIQTPGDRLVTEIKDLQRSDPFGKQAWSNYCSEEGGGVNDPSRHDPAFLQVFLDRYQSGEFGELVEQGARVVPPRSSPRAGAALAAGQDGTDQLALLVRHLVICGLRRQDPRFVVIHGRRHS